DGVALIDAGYPADTDLVLDTVRYAGHDLDDLRRVYVTHGHVDHVGGIPGILARYPHVEVLAHADELDNVRGPSRQQVTGDPLRRPPSDRGAVRAGVHRDGLRRASRHTVPGRRAHGRVDRVPAARGQRDRDRGRGREPARHAACVVVTAGALVGTGVGVTHLPGPEAAAAATLHD
ncbi:MBL fold metallo-hydrolase, partial [Bacillus sp. S34]|nr:MBL fold metallo-hydrolase [Bacillus sp. S34]